RKRAVLLCPKVLVVHSFCLSYFGVVLIKFKSSPCVYVLLCYLYELFLCGGSGNVDDCPHRNGFEIGHRLPDVFNIYSSCHALRVASNSCSESSSSCNLLSAMLRSCALYLARFSTSSYL